MEILSRVLPPDHDLILSGDWHEGTILQERGGLYKLRDRIEKEKSTFLAFGGDAVEAISVDDKRYSRDTEDPKTPTPLRQYRAIKEFFKPIARKTIFALLGNHDWMMAVRYGNYLQTELCPDLGIPYGTYTAKMSARDKNGKQMYKLFYTHGAKSISTVADDPIRREANMQLQLKRRLQMKAGDCEVMAMGHCFSEDTEILTKNGWKKHEDIGIGQSILTLNIKNDLAEWQPIEAKYIYEKKFDTMLSCRNNIVDFRVTHDHKVIFKANNKSQWKSDLARNVIKRTAITIPVSGKSGLPDYPIQDEWIALLGWLISEGHFRNNGAIQLFQAWSKAAPIRAILNYLNINHSVYRRHFAGRNFYDSQQNKIYQTKEDCATFYVSIKNAKPIRQFISKKEIPDFAFQFSDRQFIIFLDALMAGDGHWNPEVGGQNRSGSYYTKDKKLADELQALCISHGWRGNITKRENDNWAVLVCRALQTTIATQNKNTSIVPWKDVKAPSVVWCVTVPNGTVFIRRNGRAAVLGNTHKLLVCPPISTLYLRDDGQKIKSGYTEPGTGQYIHPDMRYYANTGSFLRLYAPVGTGEPVSGYAERFGCDPVELGYIVIECRGGKIKNVRKEVVA